jgi:hypothetical protein
MTKSKVRAQSRGMTVVAVLVCLVVISLVGGALLKVGLAHRNVVRAQEQRLQSEWLAESGIQRALARLAGDRNYDGEEWLVSAADLGLPERPVEPGSTAKSGPAAVVTIAVEKNEGGTSTRRVSVQADFPREGPGRSRTSRHVLYEFGTSKPGVKP